VRQAWVGLILPVAGPLQNCPAYGVLSGPKTWLGELIALITGSSNRVSGYPVESQVAVAILAESNPEAADWWRVNTPHLLTRGRTFVFQAPVCQEEP
jgi:hypothetical protein